MNSISRGFRLAKASWQVVREDRELLWLPVISFFCSLIVMAVFALGALGIGLPENQSSQISPALYVLGFVMYVALAFVSIYFNAAVIGTAMKRLQGEDASIHDGLALARQHIGKIFVWAVITATVGMILRSLQERAGILGRIVLGIVGIAWTVLTFFVVPVLLFEPVGVGDAIKRSGSIFRQRWGETFVGNGTIGIAIFLVSIPVLIVGGLIAAVVPALGIVLLVVAIGILMAIGSATTGVFNAALYRYATTGETSGAFTQEDMAASFRPKRGGGGGLPPMPV
ncbi:MAG TPA: DUF6159 family protein [Actinomycetota bacterium]|jgi:hypothetical protein